MPQLHIDKSYIIFVEGKLDEIILKLVLNHLLCVHPDLEGVINRTQIFNMQGKDNLKSGVRFAINKQKEIVKAILIILDKDENYQSTKQKLENFLNNFLWIPIREYLIIPDENSSGQELEDYLVTSLKELDKEKISILEKCIDKISSKRKIGKKVFYTYLLINDECNYDGLSISGEMLSSCVSIENLNLIKDKVLNFLKRIISEGGN